MRSFKKENNDQWKELFDGISSKYFGSNWGGRGLLNKTMMINFDKEKEQQLGETRT